MATERPNRARPYIAQDVQEIAALVRELEGNKKGSKKSGVQVKKTTFRVDGSRDGATVDSWKMNDWDYKKRDLPTYARGLFTTRTAHNAPEIAVRGYDKFFNVGEVRDTEWDNIQRNTQGPYELSLKENGCIIFIAGMEDDTLLICSKHSTGARGDVELSHAKAGEKSLEKQLAALGKTKEDLARELRARNVTAVAELCDDSFEEHILAYGPDKAGLYLHGMNLNLPEFHTYPSEHVEGFAKEWGFHSVECILMNDIETVKSFLEETAETGAWNGRDVEGFVIRCRMSRDPARIPYCDWFFKYKFEEPYLMYRQWRECTKALISGKSPKYKKHVKITEEYLLYARKRFQANPKLAPQYNKNHGIIALRDDFLAFKNIKGAEAANIELETDGESAMTEVTGDVLLVPIATIGCGKTTIAVALQRLFGWGHVQNDNITGKGRPPRFTKACIDELKTQPVVVADRNNAQKHERQQILRDAKIQNMNVRLVALYFKHDQMDKTRAVTQARVLERGDNHQTIHASTDKNKFIGVMEGFLQRFEPCTRFSSPDDGFDTFIELDPAAESRQNLETVIRGLNRIFPNVVKEIPSAEDMDEAIKFALGYEPAMRHTIPDRGKRNAGPQPPQAPKSKRRLEYMSVDLPRDRIKSVLDNAFKSQDAQTSRFYTQLDRTRRIQPKFHVTLMHRASASQHPEIWDRYMRLYMEPEAKEVPVSRLGKCGVMLERVVFDDRVMAIVVRLIDSEGKWECVNRLAHITVGTRGDSVKPKESNDLLARWLEIGATNGIGEVVFDDQPTLEGDVRGVESR